MFYESTIYPLQDKVMAALNGTGTRFYLTGGTVLSRCYFHHRYSDDLDFFVNDDGQFGQYMIAVYSALKKAGIALELPLKDAWGNDFLYKHGTGKGKDVYFIASPGKDGIFYGWE